MFTGSSIISKEEETTEILPSIKDTVDDIVEQIASREINNGISSKKEEESTDDSIIVIKIKSPTSKRGRPLSRRNENNNKKKGESTSPTSRSPSPTKKEMMAKARLRAKEHTKVREYNERWAKYFQENEKEVINIKRRLEEIEKEKKNLSPPPKKNQFIEYFGFDVRKAKVFYPKYHTHIEDVKANMRCDEDIMQLKKDIESAQKICDAPSLFDHEKPFVTKYGNKLAFAGTFDIKTKKKQNPWLELAHDDIWHTLLWVVIKCFSHY
jgi:hypothetical protein